MPESRSDQLEPANIVKIIGTLNPEQRRVFEIFGGRQKAMSQRAVEDADLACPYCGSEDVLYDNDLREDFNITIQECEDCGMEWCKEQSMKIPAILVRKIALSLRADPSYTGVSEFVRAAIRHKCELVSNSPSVAAERNLELFANAMMSAYDEYEDEE